MRSFITKILKILAKYTGNKFQLLFSILLNDLEYYMKPL
jgi:hypothetical protein